MTKPKQHKVVIVRWLDTATAHGWEAIEEAKAHQPMPAISVGILLQDDSTGVVIAQSLVQDGDVNEISAIPRGMIQALSCVGTASFE